MLQLRVYDWFLILLAVSLASGCGRRAGDRDASAWFEYGNRFGIQFVHEVETSGRHLYSESVGSGAAFVDVDNDGRLDVFLVHNVNPKSDARNRLYRQQPDGIFTDASAGSGLEAPGYINGVAVGDVNNDGLPEILTTEYDRIRLFLNEGGGKFSDVTERVGLTNRQWSVPAAFFDYDRDGWLDLVVGNYVDYDPTQKCLDARGQPDFCGPHGFHSTVTRLFRNLGAAGGKGAMPRFQEVTVEAGLAGTPGKAMQIVCADFDGDHWPDIFITDDGLPNRLFVNQRNGTFRDEAVARGLAYTGMGAALANMGVGLGDVNGDGLFDVFVPHLTEESHTLWVQGPRGIFRDETGSSGLLDLAAHGTGFGAVLADFDCDGDDDLAVSNGLVRRRRAGAAPTPAPDVASFWIPYAEPAQLFANAGSGRFGEVSAENPALCGVSMVGRGLVCGDLDNDGGLDLLAVGLAGPIRVCRNVASRQGHWLGLRIVDPALGGRDAYGAEVTVSAGGRRWWRVVQPAYSYASSNDPRVHVGLGQATQLESLLVLWPDGTEERFVIQEVDRYLTLSRGSGTFTERDGR